MDIVFARYYLLALFLVFSAFMLLQSRHLPGPKRRQYALDTFKRYTIVMLSLMVLVTFAGSSMVVVTLLLLAGMLASMLSPLFARFGYDWRPARLSYNTLGARLR